MPLNLGIVGLPNVGKTMIFSALTSTIAESANYNFSTINPNIGTVNVPDKRLKRLTEIYKPKKEVHNTIEFVDIAGLAKGASKGEGMGNKFLAHIRQVGAVVQVVRCFDDDDVLHTEDTIDPLRDIETIELELAFSDLETVTNRIDKLSKFLRSNDMQVRAKAKLTEPLLLELQETLNEGKPIRSLNLSQDKIDLVKDLNLITLKDMIYCCNIDENSLEEDNYYVKAVRKYGEENNCEVVSICGKLEAEIAQLETEEEREEYLEAVGLKESGLNQLIRAGYKCLNLQSFFTGGDDETRAWTFKKGSTAPQCAGVIHSDFQRGFIKAAVFHCEDIFELGSEQAIKDAGKLRIEGKEYIVKDGDVIHFRFNV